MFANDDHLLACHFDQAIPNNYFSDVNLLQGKMGTCVSPFLLTFPNASLAKGETLSHYQVIRKEHYKCILKTVSNIVNKT